MAEISMLYFAGLRDLLGIESETLQTPQGSNIAALQAILLKAHPTLEGHLESVRFARNEEFATNEYVLSQGDTVALIPPVTGG